MVKNIIYLPKFSDKVKKLDSSFKERVKKLIEKITESPETGKPMRYDRRGTREVYVGSFRLSYVFDKNSDFLYLLDFYHKDEQ